jgi:K+-transporting ATPase KdpF subunit
MSTEYLLGGLVSVVLLGYLLYALVYPERFS